MKKKYCHTYFKKLKDWLLNTMYFFQQFCPLFYTMWRKIHTTYFKRLNDWLLNIMHFFQQFCPFFLILYKKNINGYFMKLEDYLKSCTFLKHFWTESFRKKFILLSGHILKEKFFFLALYINAKLCPDLGTPSYDFPLSLTK